MSLRKNVLIYCLNWLPFCQIIDFKILLRVYKWFKANIQYIYDLLRSVQYRSNCILLEFVFLNFWPQIKFFFPPFFLSWCSAPSLVPGSVTPCWAVVPSGWRRLSWVGSKSLTPSPFTPTPVPPSVSSANVCWRASSARGCSAKVTTRTCKENWKIRICFLYFHLNVFLSLLL